MTNLCDPSPSADLDPLENFMSYILRYCGLLLLIYKEALRIARNKLLEMENERCIAYHRSILNLVNFDYAILMQPCYRNQITLSTLFILGRRNIDVEAFGKGRATE